MIKRYRQWIVETVDGDYVLYTDHLAAIAEKDKENERLEAENDNMRKIFDGLMAILPPEYFVKRERGQQFHADPRKCGHLRPEEDSDDSAMEDLRQPSGGGD